MTAERDWDDAFAGIRAGLSQDTAACKNGGHRIHQDTDGRWADDDGEKACPAGPDPGLPHEPVTGAGELAW